MARPRNKYERIQEKRKRLERLYNRLANNGYPCGVRFIINDSDYGERLYNEYKYCYGSKYRCIYDKGKGIYITWRRPVESNYTVVRCYTSKHSSHSFYKRYSNKILRKKKELYNGNQYRKVFDYWWTLY